MWKSEIAPSHVGNLMAKTDFSGLARTCPAVDIFKILSRGQHRYGADADWGVLDSVHIGTTCKYDSTVRVRRRCGLVKLLRPFAV